MIDIDEFTGDAVQPEPHGVLHIWIAVTKGVHDLIAGGEGLIGSVRGPVDQGLRVGVGLEILAVLIHVTHFPGTETGAAVELAVDQNGAADAGTNGHTENMLLGIVIAPQLAEQGTIHIVFDPAGDTGAVLNTLF